MTEVFLQRDVHNYLCVNNAGPKTSVELDGVYGKSRPPGCTWTHVWKGQESALQSHPTCLRVVGFRQFFFSLYFPYFLTAPGYVLLA